MHSNQTSNYGSTERLRFSHHTMSTARSELLLTINVCQIAASPGARWALPVRFMLNLFREPNKGWFCRVLTFSWVWARSPAPGWRTRAWHAWRCRRCGCTRSRRCSRDPATFEPMSPCHREAESPRIQRAGIQGVLAGEGCSGCYHEERSLTNEKKKFKVIIDSLLH